MFRVGNRKVWLKTGWLDSDISFEYLWIVSNLLLYVLLSNYKIAIFQGIFPNVANKTTEATWQKKTDKDKYHIPNSFIHIQSFFHIHSLSNIMGKIMGKVSERIILQEAVSLLTESKFFWWKKCLCISNKIKMYLKPCFL